MPTTANRHRLKLSASIIGLSVALIACGKEPRTENVRAPQIDVAAKTDTAPPIYFEFQVEVPATPFPNQPRPKYPERLRSVGIEGDTYVQFVVNQDSTIDMSTFRVLQESDPRFSQAVKEALAKTRYEPAYIGGKPVRSLVRNGDEGVHFSFRLDQ